MPAALSGNVIPDWASVAQSANELQAGATDLQVVECAKASLLDPSRVGSVDQVLELGLLNAQELLNLGL